MDTQVLLQQLLNGVSLGGVYALMAVGFGLIFNILKFSNFSHGAVMTICAYIGFYISCNIFPGFWVSLLATTVIGGVIGVVIEKLVFRPIRVRGKPLTFFFVNSVTVMMLTQVFFSAMWGSEYCTYPELMKVKTISLGDLVVSKAYLLMLGISTVALLGLSFFLNRTKDGIAVRASSSDIRTPALMGIDTDRIISITFFIAGVLAALAGYFLGMAYTVTPFLGSSVIKGIIASIIGGMGSLAGGVIAGVLLGVIESFLVSEVGASLTPILIWSGIIVLLLVRPQGIAGKIYTIKA